MSSKRRLRKLTSRHSYPSELQKERARANLCLLSDSHLLVTGRCHKQRPKAAYSITQMQLVTSSRAPREIAKERRWYVRYGVFGRGQWIQISLEQLAIRLLRILNNEAGSADRLQSPAQLFGRLLAVFSHSGKIPSGPARWTVGHDYKRILVF